MPEHEVVPSEPVDGMRLRSASEEDEIRIANKEKARIQIMASEKSGVWRSTLFLALVV